MDNPIKLNVCVSVCVSLSCVCVCARLCVCVRLCVSLCVCVWLCSGGTAWLDDASARSERRTNTREDEAEPVADRRREPDVGGEEEEDPEEPEETRGHRDP